MRSFLSCYGPVSRSCLWEWRIGILRCWPKRSMFKLSISANLQSWDGYELIEYLSWDWANCQDGLNSGSEDESAEPQSSRNSHIADDFNMFETWKVVVSIEDRHLCRKTLDTKQASRPSGCPVTDFACPAEDWHRWYGVGVICWGRRESLGRCPGIDAIVLVALHQRSRQSLKVLPWCESMGRMEIMFF